MSVLNPRSWFRAGAKHAAPAVVKASAVSGGRTRILTLGSASWTGSNIQRQIAAAYERNVIAYRCVSETAKCAASVPLLAYQGDADLGQAHPLNRLIDRPNPDMSGAMFREWLYGYYRLAGNAYVERVKIEGMPRELWLQRPDRMEIDADQRGRAYRYRYRLEGRITEWTVDPITSRSDILHLRSFNPLHDGVGLSPLSPTMNSIDQFNEAAEFNKALLQNGGRPSGVLKTEGELTQEQYDRLLTEIVERYSGPRNSARPMILEGNLSWQETAISPKDMEFLEGMRENARNICRGFGVPPQIIGIPGDSTYANYAEAREAFWDQTVIPLVQETAGGLGAWLGPDFGAGVTIEPDLDSVPALEYRRAAKWTAVSAATFLTINEKREAVGYAPVEGGDKVYEPAGQLPIDYELPIAGADSLTGGGGAD